MGPADDMDEEACFFRCVVSSQAHHRIPVGS